jgi:hypothetical protein
MTALDDRLILKVLAIVAKYGKTVTFTTVATKEFSPTTRVGIEAGKVQYPKKVTPPANYSTRQLSDTVLADDLQIYLPASGLEFTPVVAMMVEFDDMKFRVVRAGPIYTGTSVALWDLQLRRGDGRNESKGV